MVQMVMNYKNSLLVQSDRGPLITTIIPAFNAAVTIGRALESVLAQTYSPLEIIVVNDASTDYTADIVKAYGGRGVKLVSLERQRGASAARNAGIAAARGELVAFLDADDEWLPLKLEKQVALLLSEPGYVFVACAADEFSTSGMYLGDLYRGRRPSTGSGCWKSLLARNTVATPSVVVWRRELSKVGGFDESLRVGEDQDMWIRLACGGPVGYLGDCLVRIHNQINSLSSNPSIPALRIALRVIERHVNDQKARLTRADIRKIQGERLEGIGRAECLIDYAVGTRTLCKIMATGYRPLPTAFYLLNASPPSRWVKKRLFQGSRCDHGREQSPGTPARTLHPMVPVRDSMLVRFSASERPRLVVIVDAEEEFDWKAPFSRYNRSVRTMAAQTRAHEIFRRFAVVPTYATDYPVVDQDEGYRPLLELMQAGECEIGAQLHPWVTPPFEETVSDETSYPGNLPGALERKKLEILTEKIEQRFGTRPRLYRAGRYGAGINTAATLAQLEYDIDCSVVPVPYRGPPHVPDYAGATAEPYWLPTQRPLLELPVTAAAVGPGRHLGTEFHHRTRTDAAMRLGLPSLLARTGLLKRIRLSPEGASLREGKHLTRSLVRRGYRFFALSYHSPSLEPGHTPYVRTARDLARFLAWIEQYLEFFFGELNGLAETSSGTYAWARLNSIPLRP
ncbi:MAG TPA: glycosyltransferase [Rhizomicrobium sp.]|jgi:glycosyltransferase involved in cell wall biosynthesis|nr:glycosyltransferase [Rhizomicrobium sp.]